MIQGELNFFWASSDARNAARKVAPISPDLLWHSDVIIWETTDDTIGILEWIACRNCQDITDGRNCTSCWFDFQKPHQFLVDITEKEDISETSIKEEIPWKRKRASYKLHISSGLTYDVNNLIIDLEKGIFFLPFKHSSSSREKLAVSGEFDISFTEAFYASERKRIPNAHVRILKKYEWKKNGFYMDGRWYTVMRQYREDFNYKQLSKFLRSKIEGSNIS